MSKVHVVTRHSTDSDDQSYKKVVGVSYSEVTAKRLAQIDAFRIFLHKPEMKRVDWSDSTVKDAFEAWTCSHQVWVGDELVFGYRIELWEVDE